jgi:hypothetical protein
VVVHTYKLHEVPAAAGAQVPAPSHLRAVMKLLPSQVAAAHSTVAACFRQAPAPLQAPSSSQEAGALAVHSLSASWPAGMGLHSPSGWPVLARVHA